uniref:Secreted protein n=1 Tax=Mycena chlorophos TaxID=658473 RepID=A0ABQ0L4H3_MYCCL|nr:predicted protein [Mycena chlorophos]
MRTAWGLCWGGLMFALWQPNAIYLSLICAPSEMYVDVSGPERRRARKIGLLAFYECRTTNSMLAKNAQCSWLSRRGFWGSVECSYQPEPRIHHFVSFMHASPIYSTAGRNAHESIDILGEKRLCLLSRIGLGSRLVKAASMHSSTQT